MQLTEQNNTRYRNNVTSFVTKEASQCDVGETPASNIPMNKKSDHSDTRKNTKENPYDS